MAPDHSEGFLKLVRDAKSRIKEEDFRETKKRLDAGEKIILVDTREDSEWARGHIPGAIHLGKGVIERDIEKTIPDKETTVVLILRRRLPFRARCGQSSEDGLPQRDFHGRRLARLDRSRIPHHQGLARSLARKSWLGRLDSNQHRPH